MRSTLRLARRQQLFHNRADVLARLHEQAQRSAVIFVRLTSLRYRPCLPEQLVQRRN